MDNKPIVSATKSTATESTATESTATQSTATQSTATQSTATQPTATQPMATQSTVTQSMSTQSPCKSNIQRSSNPSNLEWRKGLKPRKPTALLRGKEYKVNYFVQEKSLYPNKKTGTDIFKTIAVYEDFKMKFYTYLPIEYDNKGEDFIKDLNNKIINGQNIRIVFYGCIGVANEVNILEHDEAVDLEKLQSIQLIEESEKGCTTPLKRSSSSVSDDQPSPKKPSLSGLDSQSSFD